MHVEHRRQPSPFAKNPYTLTPQTLQLSSVGNQNIGTCAGVIKKKHKSLGQPYHVMVPKKSAPGEPPRWTNVHVNFKRINELQPKIQRGGQTTQAHKEIYP